MVPGRDLRAGFLFSATIAARNASFGKPRALRRLHDFDIIQGAGHCSRIVFSMDRASKPCISAGSFAVRAADAAAPLRSVMRRGKQEPVLAMSPIPPIDPPRPSPAATFFAGWRAAWTSVFALVL